MSTETTPTQIADELEAALRDASDNYIAMLVERHKATILSALRSMVEIDDLRCSVVAFAAPWAMEYAQGLGAPPCHIHSAHYDILAKAGARMDDFTRWEPKP